MEYSSNAKGNLATTLGAIGTGLGLLNGGLGLFGNMTNNSTNNANNYVTKDEMNYIQEISSKDAEIANLKAESVAESKMIEVYTQAHSEIASLRDATTANFKEMQTEINQNRREQDAWNTSQSVANAQMSSAIAVNNSSIASINNLLGNLTKTVIPASNVCASSLAISGTTIA